jgi:hypothetical protein
MLPMQSKDSEGIGLRAGTRQSSQTMLLKAVFDGRKEPGSGGCIRGLDLKPNQLETVSAKDIKLLS